MNHLLPATNAGPVPCPIQLSRIQWGLQSTGGLCCEGALVDAMACAATDARRLLDRWIADRHVLSLTWLGRRLLPAFQFDFRAASLRPAVGQVVREFDSVFSEWECVEWFATPNLWLADSAPADMALRDPGAVIGAARADRYIAVGKP